jgi:hypothetical protein
MIHQNTSNNEPGQKLLSCEMNERWYIDLRSSEVEEDLDYLNDHDDGC